MKLRIYLSGFLLLFSSLAFSSVSARRENHESFASARDRHLMHQVFDMSASGRTAFDLAQRLDRIDFNQVADVGSLQNLRQIFLFIRDTKFLTHLNQPLAERRLSWMYPDDGCYIRAELASYFTGLQKMPETYKIFGFGNLAVKSINHPEGVVRWWYHVVPVYRVGRQAYALDPSIDPRGPLTVEEWKKAMESDGPVDKFAICKPRTVGPEEDCQNPRGQSFDGTLRSQKEFLNFEWNRLISLGRNPEVELGDSPPWH